MGLIGEVVKLGNAFNRVITCLSSYFQPILTSRPGVRILAAVLKIYVL